MLGHTKLVTHMSALSEHRTERGHRCTTHCGVSALQVLKRDEVQWQPRVGKAVRCWAWGRVWQGSGYVEMKEPAERESGKEKRKLKEQNSG